MKGERTSTAIEYLNALALLAETLLVTEHKVPHQPHQRLATVVHISWVMRRDLANLSLDTQPEER